ncbi:MAG: glutamate--tRNA ligase [Actinomycetota bacterium]|nr:glutamate--tRNA ligase [Actinomycetota bacterium]
MADVRLRFSPSPTGYFHVGGARTALFNWLMARREGGTFILRIEDTDTERNKPEWVEGIQSAMRWLGLDWDEGPYFQSQRAHLYAEAAGRLHAGGRAYYCDCTKEVVQERTRERPTPGYDGFCRDRGLGPGPGRALRFRVPDEGATTVVDVIRGSPTFEHATIEDFVIVRSNGTSLFVLANVVDDADMGVTHVVRAEEHLPTTPKYVLLHSALAGGELPVFAHVPVLVDERRQKLSKRRHRVALEDYRDQGFLPEAMRNYLVLLGWSPPDGREILPVEDMIDQFRLEDVNSSPAFFDERKLLHFNAEYIRALPPERFAATAEPFLARGSWSPEDFDGAAFAALAPLVQERVRTLAEVPAMVEFLFLPEAPVDEPAWAKRVERAASAREILADARAAYERCAWEAVVLHEATAAIAEAHGLGLAKAQFPIRVAVTGRDVGPPLFESLQVLGRDRVLERIDRALARLGS